MHKSAFYAFLHTSAQIHAFLQAILAGNAQKRTKTRVQNAPKRAILRRRMQHPRLSYPRWCAPNKNPVRKALLPPSRCMLQRGHAATEAESPTTSGLAKGFCRAKFWAKFPFGGGQFGAKFFAKFAAKFFTKFSALFCWDIQSKKNFSKNFSPKFPLTLAQQSWRNFRAKLHDEVLQGDPCQKIF